MSQLSDASRSCEYADRFRRNGDRSGTAGLGGRPERGIGV